MNDGKKSPVWSNRFDTTFLKELQEFQNKFSEYFKVSSIIFADPTKTIDEIHTESCSFFSDIAETIIPIKYKDETISTWAVTKNCFGDIPREEIDDVAKKIGADPDKLWDELQDLPTTTQEEFDKSVYFLHETIKAIMRMREQDEELAANMARFEVLTKVTAHDMREHLRLILGFIALLDDRYRSKIGPEFDTYLYYIVDSGNRLKDVADDLIETCEQK